MRSILKSRFPRYLISVGGASEIGQAVTRIANKRFDVLSIDTQESKEARWNILYDPSANLKTQIQQISSQVESDLNTADFGVDAVICTAGAGKVLFSDDTTNLFSRWNEVESRVVAPALLSSLLAYKYLNPKGMCTFFGSYEAFVKTSPKKLEEHTAYVCVHNIAMNLASKKIGRGVPDSANVFTLLTDFIGTKEMKLKYAEIDWRKHPNEEDLAKLIWSWVKSPDYRPFNNSFLRVKKENKVCETEAI